MATRLIHGCHRLLKTTRRLAVVRYSAGPLGYRVTPTGQAMRQLDRVWFPRQPDGVKSVPA